MKQWKLQGKGAALNECQRTSGLTQSGAEWEKVRDEVRQLR